MNFKIPHLAIDTETLGKGERAVITAFSACIFNFEEDANLTYDEILKKTFYVKLDVVDQIKRFKRVTDQSTLDWWKTQPLHVQEMSIKKSDADVKVDDAIVMFRDYLKDNGFVFSKSYIWTRGNAFDIPKMETIIEDVALSPIKNSFNKDFNDKTSEKEKKLMNNFRARDIRTYSDLVGDTENGKVTLTKERQPENFIEHHAKHDIALDVFKMLIMYHE